MRTGQKATCLALGLLMLVSAKALIISGTGPANLTGCPAGGAALADLKSAVGWWEGPPFGGGEWHIQFRGDTPAFQQALTNFAAIRATELDLIVHDGTGQDQFLQGDKRVDWSFTVWNPESWNNLYNNTNMTFLTNSPSFGKPVPAPQLDVYVGNLDWTKVEIPKNLKVRDERAAPHSENRQPAVGNRP
jgi:hypothetical protein